MIHTYVAHKAAQVARADTKVVVGFPAWVEMAYGGTTSTDVFNNNGLKFFNTMKISVETGYATAFASNNAFIGTFVPRGQAFMHSTGNNRVEAVSTMTGTTCYIYGSQSG